MAGRGESQWLKNPLDYHYAAYIKDCLAVLDNFHLRQVDWVGTSMGGIIGLMLATSTDRIRKLVLNDIGATINAAALNRIYAYVRTLPSAFASHGEAERYLAETFKPFGITDHEHWARFVEHSLEHISGAWRLNVDPAISEPIKLATQDFTNVTDVSLAELWQKIRIPTLILRGEESDVLDAVTLRRMLEESPRAQSVSFPGIGHAPALTTPDQINAIQRFLTSGNTISLAAGM
jgi:pimeloyl-ACP methyl ester carboxylesterase